MSNLPMLPDDGHPEGQTSDDDVTGWEYCEITGHTSMSMETYTAQAVGPASFYIAAQIGPLQLAGTAEEATTKRIRVIEDFIQRLKKDGWQPIDAHGGQWYNYRFRRRLSAQARASAEPEHWTTFAEALSEMLTRPGSLLPESITAKLGPAARDWTVRHVTQGNAEVYDKAAATVRNTVRFVADSAATAFGHPPEGKPAADPSTIYLGPQSAATHESGADSSTPFLETASAVSRARTNEGVQSLTIEPLSAEQVVAPIATTSAMLDRIKEGVTAVAEDHAAHLAMRRDAAATGTHLNARIGRQVRLMAQRVLWVITVLIEIKPNGIIDPGDVFALVEAGVGWTLDGLKLSKLERILYAVLAITPFVPARPVFGVYRRVEPWLRSEDTLTQRAATANKVNTTVLTIASSARAKAGWYFLQTQLPPWLRASIPNPLDKRYPRSVTYKALRAVASFVWLPFITYFTIVAINAFVIFEKAQWGFRTVLQTSHPAQIFLLNRILPAGQLSTSTVWFTLAGLLLLFIVALTLSTRAHHDRLREAVALATRTSLHVAHGELVSTLTDTAWRRSPSVAEKLTQSAQHLRDISLKAAKSIMMRVLLGQAIQMAVSLACLTCAAALGVMLVITHIA